jgi:hypothetical protein
MFAEMPLDNRTVNKFAASRRHHWPSEAALNIATTRTT